MEWFNVGDYKQRANMVGDSKTTPPSRVKKEVQQLLFEYQQKETVTFEDIVEFHYHFEKIHPFQDGNGRTGRLILFRECMKNGIVPVVIEDANRNEYLDALKEYREEKSLNKMISLFEKEQQFYLEKCKYFM